jgi:tyrosyl-tRNA synthetase
MVGHGRLMKSEFLSVLARRGFIKDCTDLAGLDALCAKGPIKAYIGFDMTADSLHVGSLIQIMVLRHLVKTGNHAFILLGGATTKVGDPTGKDSMRPLLTAEQIEANRIGIQKVFDRLVLSLGNPLAKPMQDPALSRKIQGDHFPTIVNNDEWVSSFDLMDYLRDYGPHFTINRMLTLDSVRSRLERQEPMTFLEFNYMLLQAIDFRHLHAAKDVVLQIGGSDQWGNIVNGVDLIRRMDEKQAFGLTTPLMTNVAGEKMGKTAGGAVWLDPDKTSPFDFWQFWRNVEDEKVGLFLCLFTDPDDVDDEVINHLMSGYGPGIVKAKEFLATEVTALVHGREAAEMAQEAAGKAQKGQKGEGLPVVEVSVTQPFLTLSVVALDAGLATSKGDAFRTALNGGVRVDGEKVQAQQMIKPLIMQVGEEIVMAFGKKKVALIRGVV